MSLTLPTTAAHAPLVVLAMGIDMVSEVDLDGCSPEQLLGWMRDLEVQRRQLEAQFNRVVEAVERTEAHAVDGHLNTQGALRHVCRHSSAQATGHVRLARALRQVPAFRAAWRAGEVPLAHAQLIATLASNPRVADQLPDSDEFFTEQARLLDARCFRIVCKRWEQLADQDGAEDQAARNHRRRSARLSQDFDGAGRLEATFGDLQYAIVESTLRRYEDREFDADWAEAKERLGDAVTPDALERTPAQRRADALLAIFKSAAADIGDRVALEPLVNVIVDAETFERAMATAAGAELPDDDPTRALGMRSETLSGLPLPVLDVAALAAIGHVRRVVVDADGVVIDLGRRQRFFTGSARDAVLLGGWPDLQARCFWPGCDAPVERLHGDHIDPWRRGGPTSPHNGQPACNSHNSRKEAGYRSRATDPTVRLRPDDRPITPPA